MKALFLSILALLPAAASAQRDTLGVLERSSVFSAEDERAVAGFHTESPAMMLYRSEQSLSQISLRIDLRREQEALLQPLGDGAFDGGFYAESYRRLSERSATWADARYVRGNRRNVCWNSTADYLLLYPCITADSAGGKPLDRGICFRRRLCPPGGTLRPCDPGRLPRRTGIPSGRSAAPQRRVGFHDQTRRRHAVPSVSFGLDLQGGSINRIRT